MKPAPAQRTYPTAYGSTTSREQAGREGAGFDCGVDPSSACSLFIGISHWKILEDCLLLLFFYNCNNNNYYVLLFV